MSENELQRLLDIKKKIEKSQSEVLEINAQKKLLLQQLQEKWNCGTVEMAEELLEEKQQELIQKQIELESLIHDIRTNYELV